MPQNIKDMLRSLGAKVDEDEDVEAFAPCELKVSDVKELCNPSRCTSDEQKQSAITLLQSVDGLADEVKVVVSADAVKTLGGTVECRKSKSHPEGRHCLGKCAKTGAAKAGDLKT